MDNVIKVKIEHEISLIDEELNVASPLIELCKLKIPDSIEIRAMAQILHSFYNGIEKTLILIFKAIGENLPNDSVWHKTLLNIAFGQNLKGFKIFRDDIRDLLNEYLSLRHFIRHSYSYQLKWERMNNLVNNLEDTWVIVKSDFEKFIEVN